jgi:hypothetical protein
MKICVVFAALATASLAAVSADAHVRAQACGHVSHRPIVHRAVAHHIVRRSPVRHLAAHSARSSLRFAACGCDHAARARIAYDEREYRPRHWHPYFATATYFRPRPVFYRPRMIYYEEHFPTRRFHRYGGYAGGFGGGSFRDRDRDRDFEHRRFAMADRWGR